jgi:hypothetical protein
VLQRPEADALAVAYPVFEIVQCFQSCDLMLYLSGRLNLGKQKLEKRLVKRKFGGLTFSASLARRSVPLALLDAIDGPRVTCTTVVSLLDCSLPMTPFREHQ